VVEEDQKAQIVFDHFDAILGSYESRSTQLEKTVADQPEFSDSMLL
jgi:hypothetical protein